jgi:hypothetical protein
VRSRSLCGCGRRPPPPCTRRGPRDPHPRTRHCGAPRAAVGGEHRLHGGAGGVRAESEQAPSTGPWSLGIVKGMLKVFVSYSWDDEEHKRGGAQEGPAMARAPSIGHVRRPPQTLLALPTVRISTTLQVLVGPGRPRPARGRGGADLPLPGAARGRRAGSAGPRHPRRGDVAGDFARPRRRRRLLLSLGRRGARPHA